MAPKKKQPQKKKECVLVVCAHNDDQIIGAGGTLAKYAQEGIDFYTIIMSYGEQSHPHYKEDVIVKIRVKEALDSNKVLGGNDVFFFGLKEGKFLEEFKTHKVKQTLKKFIKDKKPTKIFTHSLDDPHTDHRNTFQITKESVEELKYKGDLYSFNVWNPINIRKRDSPKMVVDISDTFSKKVEAFKCHKSQKPVLVIFGGSVWLNALLAGLSHGCKYAEEFVKVR